MVISGASQINDTLDGNETGTPASLRSRLVHAYLHQLDATCGMEDATARLEIPLHPVPGPQASASMH